MIDKHAITSVCFQQVDGGTGFIINNAVCSQRLSTQGRRHHSVTCLNKQGGLSVSVTQF